MIIIMIIILKGKEGMQNSLKNEIEKIVGRRLKWEDTYESINRSAKKVEELLGKKINSKNKDLKKCIKAEITNDDYIKIKNSDLYREISKRSKIEIDKIFVESALRDDNLNELLN
jgi:hypothetical protein